MRGACAALALGGVIAVAFAGTGCDWRTFDDLAKKTPVARISAPSDYSAKDQFGSIMLAVPPPQDGSAAGRFVATGRTAASVAVVSFDASGNPKGMGVTAPAFDVLMGSPLNAIAEVPGERRVVLGAPWTTFGDVLMMELDKPNVDFPYPATLFAEVPDPGFGAGVAAGNIGGGAAPEIVVLSSSAVHVFVDELPTNHLTPRTSMGAADPCPIEFPSNLLDRDRVNRAVIVAPLLASGTQIAVGAPAASGAGHVSIFDVDVTTGAFTCSATLMATEARFGRAMTLVDVDGNGTPDHLLVGAPPTHAYLYALPLSTGQAPSAMATAPTVGDFGAAIAAFNIDKNPGDEMFVGDPDAAVGGTTNAGNVTVYTGPTMTMLASKTTFPNPLAEHDPGSGHGYGSGIVGMTFCPANVLSPAVDGGVADAGAGGIAACGPLPLIGSLSNVFAYFTLNPPDPRAK
jgi:hypothetical protein